MRPKESKLKPHMYKKTEKRDFMYSDISIMGFEVKLYDLKKDYESFINDLRTEEEFETLEKRYKDLLALPLSNVEWRKRERAFMQIEKIRRVWRHERQVPSLEEVEKSTQKFEWLEEKEYVPFLERLRILWFSIFPPQEFV